MSADCEHLSAAEICSASAEMCKRANQSDVSIRCGYNHGHGGKARNELMPFQHTELDHIILHCN